MKRIFGSKLKLILIFTVCIFVALLALVTLRHPNESTKYPYVAGRLFGKENNDTIINFTPLREAMKAQFAANKRPIGIYFEYLPTGASIGVNDQLEVEIGSLAKVPAVMSIYKQIDAGKLDINKTLTVQENNLDPSFGNLWKKGAGTTLSTKEAIEYTLKQSDNTAASTLVSQLPSGALQNVFDSLDLPRTRTGAFPVMSPKSYASVMRNLYLSAYNSISSSNQILEYLTSTNYNDKIPSGVAESTKVAHKIGVFKLGEEQVYGDCGIVYVPKRPYILCIMSVSDEETARADMQNYSKMVYGYVTQTTPNK